MIFCPCELHEFLNISDKFYKNFYRLIFIGVIRIIPYRLSDETGKKKEVFLIKTMNEIVENENRVFLF